MGKVLVFGNAKGGVGKSTSATALSSILADRGFRTLLIDCDTQCNSTDTYRADSEGAATVYDVLLDENRMDICEAIQHTERGDILAGDSLLRQADDKLKNSVDGLYRMADALENCTGYDYIVIDTAPAMNSILHNCLIAADEVIIPVTADRYALQGLSQLFETIRAIRRRQNPDLKIAGLLLTKYNDRTNLSKEVRNSIDKVAAEIGTKVFGTVIRECVKVKEAQAIKETLIRYAPKCTAAEDYVRFTDELIGKVPVEQCSDEH